MAYINATLWNNLQGSNVTNDKRFSQLGVVDLAADSTPFVDYILPSQIQQMNTLSSLRSLEIPVITDQTVTVVTTPGFQYIPTNLETSDKYYFQGYDFFSGFTHVPSTYANNMVDEMAALEIKMKNVAYAIGKEMETTLLSVLSSRKTQVLDFTTQVSQGDGTFVFSTLTDTLTVNKAAQKETMFFNLQSLMEANELPGGYRIVTNRAGLAVQKAERLKYSTNNDKNLEALGMFDLSRMYESGSISAGSDVFSGYLVRDGAIGIVPNFPYDFVNGTEIAGKKWSITDMELPFCRVRANIYTSNDAVDASAMITSGTDSNTIMTARQVMGVWVRIYIVYRYNSDLTTRANDIVKIVGATS